MRLFFSQGVSFELDAVGTVDDAIHDGVGQGSLADEFVPMLDGDLRSDDERAVGRQLFDQIVEDELVGFLHGVEAEVVEDEQLKFGQLVEFFEVGAIGFSAEELIEDLAGSGELDLEAFQAGGMSQGCSVEPLAGVGEVELFDGGALFEVGLT